MSNPNYYEYTNKRDKKFSTANRSSLMHFHQLSLALEPVKWGMTLIKISGLISALGRKKELLWLHLPGYNITWKQRKVRNAVIPDFPWHPQLINTFVVWKLLWAGYCSMSVKQSNSCKQIRKIQCCLSEFKTRN